MKKRIFALAGALAVPAAVPAGAHVSLEQAEAAAGSAYKAVLRVGHGCEGSPTVAIRVLIPDGVIAVKPMPKPGWELSTRVESYEKPVQHYDQTLTEGVREIGWTGGRLPDEWYDEFVFRGMLPKGEAGTVIRFPVVQECEKGVHRWIELPAEGQDVDELAEPAPGVTLIPASGH